MTIHLVSLVSQDSRYRLIPLTTGSNWLYTRVHILFLWYFLFPIKGIWSYSSFSKLCLMLLVNQHFWCDSFDLVLSVIVTALHTINLVYLICFSENSTVKHISACLVAFAHQAVPIDLNAKIITPIHYVRKDTYGVTHWRDLFQVC